MGCGKDARWKSHKADFPTSLGNPANPAGFPLSHSPDRCWLTMKPDISRATKSGHFNLLPTLQCGSTVRLYSAAHPQASYSSLCKTLQHLCNKFVLRFDSKRKRTYCS